MRRQASHETVGLRQRLACEGHRIPHSAFRFTTHLSEAPVRTSGPGNCTALPELLGLLGRSQGLGNVELWVAVVAPCYDFGACRPSTRNNKIRPLAEVCVIAVLNPAYSSSKPKPRPKKQVRTCHPEPLNRVSLYPNIPPKAANSRWRSFKV